MEQFSQIDAYQILGLSWDAKEEDIRKAYHLKVTAGQDLEIIRSAYQQIRDTKAREHYQWNSVHSYLHRPKEPHFDLETLIKEVAFLSDWELEEIHGS